MKMRLADQYKEKRCLRVFIQVTVTFIVLVWLTGLVIGPIFLLKGHCHQFPTINQTQIFQIDECFNVRKNACRGMAIITGYFDAVCDGKNFTGVTHVACYEEVCVKSTGMVKIMIEKNFYSADPEWMWWINPGVVVYVWWAPTIFIAILITKHVIHRFFVGKEEDLEEVLIGQLSRYSKIAEEESSDEDYLIEPLETPRVKLVTPRSNRIRPLTPPASVPHRQAGTVPHRQARTVPYRQAGTVPKLDFSTLNAVDRDEMRVLLKNNRHSVKRSPYDYSDSACDDSANVEVLFDDDLYED